MLLPSPTTSDANGPGAHGTGGPDLRTAVSGMALCDGCNVREPWEHRCYGAEICGCAECRDMETVTACSYCGEPRIPSRCDNCDAGPTRAAVFAGDWGDDLMPTPRAGDGEKGGPNQRGAVTCLPTPTSRDWKDGPPCANVPDNALLGRVIHQLLPTPAVNDMGAAYDPDQWDAWTERMKAEHNNGNGHGASLNIEAQRLDMLPTPSVADGEGGHETRSGARSHERLLPGVAKYELLPTTTTKDAQASGSAGYGGNDFCTLTDATVRQPSRWGRFAAAIARWEALTRPAPEPTNVTDGYLKARAKRLARLDRRPVGMRGSLKPRRQLAARFSEWMMGVPLGWITDTPGITRNEALKAAGNGVVPQQAAEALRFLLDMPTGREIADAHEPENLLELLAVGQ